MPNLLQWPYIPEDAISFGEMQLPAWVNLKDQIEQAAKDVDAAIGQRYRLPLNLDEENQEQRAAYYLIQKITRFYVLGRVVIDSALGHEDGSLHAWGILHIRQADAALREIVAGSIKIPGAEEIVGQDEDSAPAAIIQRDSKSLVSAFYEKDEFYQRATRGEIKWP